jgi:phospholipid/cholesterol/gamma-HCH transport system substrate-binding protein
VNYTLVGAFVLLLGAMLVGGVLWLATGGDLQKKHDLYLAISEESVAGLSVDAPVKYNGVDVGKVRRITLDTKNPQHVRLLLAIERGTPIKEDTVAVLKTQGLTGIAYVELDGGSATSPALRAKADGAYPEIRTKESLSSRLETVLGGVLAKLDSASSNISAILSDANRQAFGSALADIAAVSKTVAGRRQALDAGIVSAARTFDESAKAAVHIAPTLARIAKGADAVQLMGQEAGLASQGAAKVVQAVGSDVQQFTAQTAPSVQQLLAELQMLSASMRRVSEQLERNPSSALTGRVPVADGPGEAGPSPSSSPVASPVASTVASPVAPPVSSPVPNTAQP